MTRYTATDIAHALEQDAPTDEQAAVIESTAQSCLVVAGAGSGKTETMAGRVVWLVANGLVRPDQVLGLTFTRKAAAELAARVRRRLGQLAAHGLVDAEVISAADPTISTYDAYAGRIVAENALRIGREPSQRLIPQTVAWQYARRVVDAYDGPMNEVLVSPMTVTNDVRALAEGLAQHRVTSDQLREYCAGLHAVLTALPKAANQRTTKDFHDDIAGVARALAARCQLLPIVAAYDEAKRRRECLDFADQMALAADLAEQFPEVAATERSTYRAVLLDEYQDTSHAQLVFLRALFGAFHGRLDIAPLLTAVGDPSQAIYGWRGASQGTLVAFPNQFPDADKPASVLTLSTSFRNDRNVLAVANAIAEPLRDGRVSTPELRARGTAVDGVVRCGLYPTVDDEAQAVGNQVLALWRGDQDKREVGAPTKSIAVLVRAWRQLPRIEAALRARGVPIEIVGVGGLLLEPEVVDVVATLRVMVDPARGDALMRLLTGARWRIGGRDLAALGAWARHLARTPAPAGLSADDDAARVDLVVTVDLAAAEAAAVEPDPDDVDDRSIIDALDALPAPGRFEPLGLSATAHARLFKLALELRALRSRLGQPLPDLVADVIATIGLDVEVLARGGDLSASRANLDRLIDVAAEFAAGGDDVSVAAFLDYLDAAAVEERGLDRPDEPESALPELRQGGDIRRDRVQLLTVHASKGLEWDVVCVPGLVENLFPGVRPADVRGWLTQRGSLPWPLRGDRDGLPVAELDGHVDQLEAVEAIKRFADSAKAHLLREERRLAYVAVTRARSMVICTGYRWDDRKKPREAGEFLAAVHEVCETGRGEVDCWTELPPDGTPNPMHELGPATASWPLDPLAARRPAVEAAAELVELMAVELGTLDGAIALTTATDEWSRDVEVLLAERAARTQRARLDVELPRQLSVSQLVTLRRDPDELARQLRRPLPAAPAPLARRGTAFHLWLEQRFSSPRLLDLDEVPGSADADAAPDADLAQLQRSFLATAWANRDPVEVEVPFELVIDDIVVRGRMDAVFRDTDGGFTVVDWKTGRRPAGDDARAAAIQLAAYRLAWADLTGTDLANVRAVFCYLRDGETVAPSDLLDREGLVVLLRSVPA
ncbi:MAG TPA: ATP-dependent DNA helicase [Acidothermaceae bacterium]|nr:ATP-dependent DNA helicase [Acidothermaceae bacterium]